MHVEELMREVVERNASDGFLTARAAPAVKVDGQIYSLDLPALDEHKVRDVVLATLSDTQKSDFLRTHECNYALQSEEYGRFRASAFVQRGSCGLVIRRIQTRIPRVDELGLPPIIEDLAMTKRGLVMFVGGTGTGKSTSLAAMIGHRNRNSRGHIFTVEDPIEFIHDHAGCLVTQREVGLDTDSFEVALQNALRQAPDVILIGEVRSAETMSHALAFAETGHLCLCTLHANNANQALDRILSFFPSELHNQVWMDLSLNLKAMIAQQLLPRKEGPGRVPVMEVLLNSALIADHIRNGQVHEIKGVISRSNEQGMMTLDQSLLAAYKEGFISSEEAIRSADSANDVRLGIKLHDKGQRGVASRVNLTVDDS
ncbi:MAG: PilT/PilU family type 4a pilus ATPase [Pseudohaliea sp.]